MLVRLFFYYASFFVPAAICLPCQAQHTSFTTEKNALEPDTVQVGSRQVVIFPRCTQPITGIWFVHVHEDEATAVAAVNRYMDSTGFGCMVTLQHGMGRNISFTLQGRSFQFDPNRIFTEAGRKATLQKLSNISQPALDEVAKLANRLAQKYIDSNRLIIALHNNTNDGGLTIFSYARGGNFAGDAAMVHIAPGQDPDDFFYTTSERAFEFFKSKGFNVMLQNNASVTDDGSLSVYAGILNMDYINIEAQHGNLTQQLHMIAVAMQYVQTYYSAEPAAAPPSTLYKEN